MRYAVAWTLAAAALSAAAGLAADAPADEKGPAELQGAWKLTSLESGGEDHDLGSTRVRWVVKGDKVLYAGEPFAALNADPKATPKTFDLTLADGKKAYEGVYSVEEDTLKICLNSQSEGPKERPQEFVTKDKAHLRLLTFKRDKSDAGDKEGATGYVGLALRIDKDKTEVSVADAFEGGPAQKAGLQKDDVVLKAGGAEATSLVAVIDAVRRLKPGDEIVFRVRRDGKEKEITVKAGVLPLALLLQLD
jgi:uncharacterized protein (TIGR03067 family)